MAVPVLTPVTIPLVAPIEITVLGPPVHVPPNGVEVSVAVAPTQTADGPLIGVGEGLIVIVALPVMVRLHPVVALTATTV